MKKEGTKGQAFLITAIVFIAIVGAFITLKNYSKKTEFSTFPYMAEEIQIESEKVMDYALINEDYSSINIFTQDISDYTKKEGIDIYFIEDSLGSLSCYNVDGKTCNLVVNGNEILATINGISYSFTKTGGKNFYFIMIKEDGEEKYVYKNA